MQGERTAAAPLPLDSFIGRTVDRGRLHRRADHRPGPGARQRRRSTPRGRRPSSPGSRLMERSGLVVERLRARANSDRTLAVEAAFRARGRLMRFRLPVGRTAFLARRLPVRPGRAAAAAAGARLARLWRARSHRARGDRKPSGAARCRRRRLGPVPLGDVTARLNVLPLFLGRARLSLAGADAETGLEGAVTLSRHSFGFDDVTGRFRTVALFAPLPISTLDFDDVSAGFASGRCTRAAGRVQAGVAGEIAGIRPGVGPHRHRPLRRRRFAAASGRPVGDGAAQRQALRRRPLPARPHRPVGRRGRPHPPRRRRIPGGRQRPCPSNRRAILSQ